MVVLQMQCNCRIKSRAVPYRVDTTSGRQPHHDWSWFLQDMRGSMLSTDMERMFLWDIGCTHQQLNHRSYQCHTLISK